MPLAVNNSVSLQIDQFDMNGFFRTNSAIFKKVKLGEASFSFLEKLFAVILLLIFSPIMLTVAVMIRVSMGKGVLYSQIRVGKNGIPFSIVKFRSMITNAEAATGAVLATKNDPRITRLGKFLRASHIDELPQLFNVLNGDMSFVGPRPERPEFVATFEREILGYKRRREVKPGITGLAQICLPYDATASEKLPYDIFYIDHRESVLFNLLISYYTALKMVTFYKTNG
ncbi:MAG: sugar transferase [Bacteriovoracaceae bacterium]